MAARAGVPVSTLHFYERQGLLSPLRTSGNQRRYPRHMLRIVSIITTATRLGIPLAEVAEVLGDLPEDAVPTKREWHGISRRWRDRIRARKEGLAALERELDGCLGCGCVSLQACVVLNPADVLAEDGPGPQRITPGER